MSKKLIFIVLGLALLGVAVFLFLVSDFSKKTSLESNGLNEKLSYDGKKVFYVNSYHEGLPWSDGILEGFKGEISKVDGVEVFYYNMDTKTNPSEEYAIQESLKVKEMIEDFKPDVLAINDDPAFKYLVQEYYKNSDLPVVFSGINWDLERYNGPYANTTGMLEVVLFDKSINELLSYVDGSVVGFLAEDTVSELPNANYLKENSNLQDENIAYVKNYEDWKKAYLSLQDKVDVLVIGVMGSFFDQNNQDSLNDLREFVANNTKVPTVSEHAWMVDFTLLAYGKIPQEQGEWAANASLKILNGEAPSEIAIAKNQRGELAVNLKLAERIGINFRPELIKKVNLFFE